MGVVFCDLIWDTSANKKYVSAKGRNARLFLALLQEKKNIWTYKWILNRSSDYEKWIGRNQSEASDTQGMTETLQI